MTDYDPNYVPVKHYALIGQKAVIQNLKGQILVLQRSNKAGGGGKWSLPGGGLETGEDPHESIHREIKEETGLEIFELKPFKLRSYLDGQDFIVIIGYLAKFDSEKVKLNWEHDNYKWLNPEEALKLELTEDARFFMKQVTSFSECIFELHQG